MEPDQETKDLEIIRQKLSITLIHLMEYMEHPEAPDHEIETWPLYAREQEFGGGVWCGDPDCPLEAENAEIGDFRFRDKFTLKELRTAIGDHIDWRRNRENERNE